jgi:hypothetical protein
MSWAGEGGAPEVLIVAQLLAIAATFVGEQGEHFYLFISDLPGMGLTGTTHRRCVRRSPHHNLWDIRSR